jgi:hypothetical protein
MFDKVTRLVFGVLGIKAFAKDESGKSILTDEQADTIKETYGEKFLASYLLKLADAEKDGNPVEAQLAPQTAEQLAAELETYKSELQTARARVAALEQEQREFEETINLLERTEAPDAGTRIDAPAAAGTAATKPFRPDMKLAHNRMLDAMYRGASYAGDDTIDTKQLRTEFGKYVSSERLEIIRTLMGDTESIAYMSTLITDKTEVRAAEGVIKNVLQSFVSKWTPKGKTEFTPLTIKNFKLKINVPITPAEIMEDVLGYLYDEKLEPKDMPVVKYILQQLIFPQLAEDREQALALGEYKESKATKDGDTAGSVLESMDGYITILKRLKAAGNKDVTWLLDGIALGEGDTLLAQIDKAVDSVKPLYKKQTMYIHADPDLVKKYSRAYRAKYPNTKNEDGEKVKVDFSRFTFAPLEGMRGTGVFFITPKSNFKHLMSTDPKRARVWMQSENYDVKVFAEWWESVGFWLAEAIFAYLPPPAKS